MKLEMKVDVRPSEKKQENQEKQIREIAPQRGDGRKPKVYDMGCNFLIHSSLQIPDAA